MTDLIDPAPNDQALHLLYPNGVVPSDCHIISPLNPEGTENPFNCQDSLTQDSNCNHPTMGSIITTSHISHCEYLWLSSHVLPPVVFTTFGISLSVHILCLSMALLYPPETPCCWTVCCYIFRFPIIYNCLCTQLLHPVHSCPSNSPLHLSVEQLLGVSRLQFAIAIPHLLMPVVERFPCPPQDMPHYQLKMFVSSLNTTIYGSDVEHVLRSLMGYRLKCQDNWSDWLAVEPKYLDSMTNQNTYDPPIHPPPGQSWYPMLASLYCWEGKA